MMVVEHRRVIIWTPDENAKIGIVRSPHDNRRPNLTYALVIVVIDVRMSWALRPLANLGRTEARPRLKVPFETLEKQEIESTMIESIISTVFDSALAVDWDVKHQFKQTINSNKQKTRQ